MDRYYYDDPLAAAWMMRHFGMRFRGYTRKTYPQLYDLIFFDGRWVTDPESFGTMRHLTSDELYAHPDSLHLLEPQAGDLVVTHERIAFVREDAPPINYQMVIIGQESMATYRMGLDRPQIIQRNGLAFMWPKEKAAAKTGTRPAVLSEKEDNE